MAKPDTRNYDIFKAVVTVFLLIIIAILLLQGRPASVATPAEPTLPATTPAPAAPAEVALPVIEPPIVGEDGSVSLSGTGQPGATVELWAGDVNLGDVVVGPDGTWAWDGTLDPGDHQLTAHTVDASGQALNETKPLALNVPEPAAEIALPIMEPPIVGEDGSVSLSGTGQPGATVELWAGDVNLGDVVVGPDGTWAWDGTLDPGDYQLIAHTVDASGQTLNKTKPLALNVPKPAAEVALPVMEPPTVGEDGSVSLSGTGQPGATVELWAGDVKLGDVVVGADGTWAWDGTLDPGDYQLTARTIDATGQALNESKPLALNVPKPAAEVALPVMEPPTVGEDGSVSLSGTGQPGATVEIVEDGVVIGSAEVAETGTWTFVYEAAAGAHQLAVRDQADPGASSAEVAVEVPAAAAETSETGEGEGYIVQPGDNLSALAERFYGDWSLWRLIFEATNERAAEDPSFHVIENPRLIRPGWKLWIPAR